MWYECRVQVPMGGASAAVAAAFGGVLPPGITGTNDRSTLLVSNLVPEVSCGTWCWDGRWGCWAHERAVTAVGNWQWYGECVGGG
jgi:hypothetical protein